MTLIVCTLTDLECLRIHIWFTPLLE